MPFMLFMTWSLFGILEIGMMIEEPFQKALNLEIFAETIRKDISDLLNVCDVSPIQLNDILYHHEMSSVNLDINRNSSAVLSSL